MEEGQGKEKGKAESPSQRQGASTGLLHFTFYHRSVRVHSKGRKSGVMGPLCPSPASAAIPILPFVFHSPLEPRFKENSRCFNILSISTSECVSHVLRHSRNNMDIVITPNKINYFLIPIKCKSTFQFPQYPPPQKSVSSGSLYLNQDRSKALRSLWVSIRLHPLPFSRHFTC